MLTFERVSFTEARRALQEVPGRPTESREKREQPAESRPGIDAALLRLAPQSEDHGVSSRVLDWLRQLPALVRPVELAERFPRIAKHLAAHWSSPRRCEAYLESLLISDRPDRQGFPPSVARELGRLLGHLLTLYPPAPCEDPWSQVRGK